MHSLRITPTGWLSGRRDCCRRGSRCSIILHRGEIWFFGTVGRHRPTDCRVVIGWLLVNGRGFRSSLVTTTVRTESNVQWAGLSVAGGVFATGYEIASVSSSGTDWLRREGLLLLEQYLVVVISGFGCRRTGRGDGIAGGGHVDGVVDSWNRTWLWGAVTCRFFRV